MSRFEFRLAFFCLMILGLTCGYRLGLRSWPDASVASASPLKTGSLPVWHVAGACQNFQWTFTVEDQVATDSDSTFANNTDFCLVFQRNLPLPANQSVVLHLTSADYLYSFRNDALGIHEVLVPDVPRTVAFVTPDRGVYEFRADPLCGFRWSHDEVLAEIEVVPPDSSIR